MKTRQLNALFHRLDCEQVGDRHHCVVAAKWDLDCAVDLAEPRHDRNQHGVCARSAGLPHSLPGSGIVGRTRFPIKFDDLVAQPRVAGRVSTGRRCTSSSELAIPLHPALAAVIADPPAQHLTLLTTQTGKPFSAAGFGNWFRDRCNEAGLPQCSAHGLRKAAARRLAEAGCTMHEIAAITGHASLSEVQRYTKAADQARLARAAMDKAR
jgi:hypothetical protein